MTLAVLLMLMLVSCSPRPAAQMGATRTSTPPSSVVKEPKSGTQRGEAVESKEQGVERRLDRLQGQLNWLSKRIGNGKR
jgi:hypothetical protein